MRCLHVLDALDARGPVRALAHLLRLAALESALDVSPMTHDVLALAGGPLEDEIRDHARRLTVAGSGLELTTAILTRDYEVVHALDERIARRLAPLVTSAAAAAFVYSRPALDRTWRPDPRALEPAQRAILAASDLVVLPPDGCAAADLSASLAHRSVRLDLWRLAAPPPTDGAGAPVDPDGPELTFIVREWAAVIGAAGRVAPDDAHVETLHP